MTTQSLSGLPVLKIKVWIFCLAFKALQEHLLLRSLLLLTSDCSVLL